MGRARAEAVSAYPAKPLKREPDSQTVGASCRCETTRHPALRGQAGHCWRRTRRLAGWAPAARRAPGGRRRGRRGSSAIPPRSTGSSHPWTSC
eukprot:scaffold85723_cov72-Phaeocystis_antarctica.AAC.1